MPHRYRDDPELRRRVYDSLTMPPEPANGRVRGLTVNFNTILNALILAGMMWVISFLFQAEARLTRIETKLEIWQQQQLKP